MEVQQAEYGSSTRATTLKAGSLFAAEIAAVHGFTIEQLRRRNKMARISAARFAVYWALRAPPYCWSLPRIGKFMHRDHTTVLYGVRLVERERRALMVANQP